MQRYFASINDGIATFSEADAYHFLNVMRGEVGQKIELLSQDGDVFLAEVVSSEPLQAKIIKEIDEYRENPIKLKLIFSLLKKGNDELVIQKGTELGCYSFHPFISSRTIIRLTDAKDGAKRKERGDKIIKEAVTQSKRNVAPTLDVTKKFDDILDIEADLKMIAYEGRAFDGSSFAAKLKSIKPGESVAVIIGPEGGFSEEEVAKAVSKGFIPVGLGPRILRAETASIFVCSAISLCGENKDENL